VVLAPARIPRRRGLGAAARHTQPMIGALMRLGGMQPGALPQSIATAGVNGAPGWAALFSSHPPIEERIRALQART